MTADKQKYIVEKKIPDCIPNCNTVEDLQRYLDKVPHFEYRLVSCQFVNGNYIMVWELKDEYQNP